MNYIELEIGDLCVLKSTVQYKNSIFVYVEKNNEGSENTDIPLKTNMEFKEFESYTKCVLLEKKFFSKGYSICKIYIDRSVGWVYSNELLKAI